MVKPSHHVLDVKTASLRLQLKAAPCFELKNCKMFYKRHHHSQVKAGSNRTGSMHDNSTYITFRDLTPTCTRREHLLALRRHEKLENAALKENYRHNGTITEIIELLGSTMTVLLETVGSVNGYLLPLEAQKYLQVNCGWTLRDTCEACFRVRCKPSQKMGPVVFTSVAHFNTLMLLNVYITHEFLPALIAQIPPDVFLKSECCHGSQYV